MSWVDAIWSYGKAVHLLLSPGARGTRHGRLALSSSIKHRYAPIKETMNKKIAKTKLDQLDASKKDRTIFDLYIFLSNNGEFRSSIYDHREVQAIADRFGLSPERIRSELKKLGYKLTKNGHGRMIWKSKECERINYKKRVSYLEEYISKCETRQLQFYDKSEIGRIARRVEVSRDSVRLTLRRRGYELTLNGHGIAVWIKSNSH